MGVKGLPLRKKSVVCFFCLYDKREGCLHHFVACINIFFSHKREILFWAVSSFGLDPWLVHGQGLQECAANFVLYNKRIQHKKYIFFVHCSSQFCLFQRGKGGSKSNSKIKHGRSSSIGAKILSIVLRELTEDFKEKTLKMNLPKFTITILKERKCIWHSH